MNAGVSRLAIGFWSLVLTVQSASAVMPRDSAASGKPGAVKPVERRFDASGARQTTVSARGARLMPESRIERDELRVIVRASGDPLILQPESLGASLVSLRDQRLAALDLLANDVVRTDNDVRGAHGMAARLSAQVVTQRYTHVFNGLAARVHRETFERLRKLPNVTGVWIDQQKSATLAESVPLIRADQVWNTLGYRGNGVTVAVIDTGVDYLRPDLGGCFGAGCKVEFGHDFVNNDADPMDDFGHGTHVAGIVAANGDLKGVAPLSRVWALKVLDAGGNGFNSNIIAAIEMATNPDGNPGTHDGAKIINLSLGGPGDPDDAVSQACDNAMAGGTLVVVAAGNSGPEFGSLGSPGCARQPLTVGASDKFDQMASFSSRGAATTTWQIKPEIIAPGVSITSTVPTGGCFLCDPTGYRSLSGTSMATPHVAGAAALVMERYPTWTPAQVKAAITQRTIDFAYGAFVQGAGRLDAWNAITPLSRVNIPAYSPGLDDPGQPSWTRSQAITVTNLTSTTKNYGLSVAGSFPSGLSATVSPPSLSIPGNSTRTFTFTLNVNNALVPNVPTDPFAYEGTIRAVNTGETLHIPFAFMKAPSMTLVFDQVPWTVTVTDNSAWYRFFLYPAVSLTLLTPETPFDVVTMFNDAESFVVHEGIQIASNAQVNVSRAEAIHPVTIAPVDKDGADLMLTSSTTLAHFGPKSRYFDTYLNVDYTDNLGSPTTFWLSSVSNLYDFDISVLQEPGGTQPTYFYYGLVADGINAPKTFRNTPADFRHVTWGYKVDPGPTGVFPMTWLSSRPYDTGFVLAFIQCDTSTATPFPFRREVYLTPLPNDQVGAGFLRQSVYGAPAFAPCQATNFLYDTPYFAASSVSELDAWAIFNPSPVLRTTNTLFTSGIGPYRWTGSMFNAPGTLNAFGGDSGPWFVSQVHDVRPFASVSYDLLQSGVVLESGTMSGTDTNAPFELPVDGGRYELHVPFTQWYLGSTPGRADTLLSFDTQSADANPPTLKSLRLEQGGTLVEMLPPGGGTVSFTGDDDWGVLSDARLYYKTAAGYSPAAVTGSIIAGFTATVPSPGGPAPTGPVAVFLRDAAGNALTYSYCNAATSTPEVCNGFDDNCDGVLLFDEVDRDGDAFSICGGDCDDTDASSWGTPSEVSGLVFLNHSEMQWSQTVSGGTANYYVLRSSSPSNFVAATSCVFAFDATTPAIGAAFYYQVRAWNDCPSGQGSLGTRSDGTPRAGRTCP